MFGMASSKPKPEERLNVAIRAFPLNLWKAVKIAAINEGIAVNEWMARAVRRELEKKVA